MTIRDIGILFGYKVDQASEQKVEGSIKSLKSMASKVLGAVGITLSVAGTKSAIDGCVEVASSIEEMQNKFDVVFGDMRNEVDKWSQEYSDAIGRNKNDIKTMGRGSEEGERPVSEGLTCVEAAPEYGGARESCRNHRGPSRKAKHYSVTDSEPVP